MWQSVWVPDPSNQALVVYENPPEGFEIRPSFGNYKYALIPVQKLIEQRDQGEKLDTRQFFYCRHCKGWIEGEPTSYREHTIGHLCGRQGTVSSCIRCGREISFSGKMS